MTADHTRSSRIQPDVNDSDRERRDGPTKRRHHVFWNLVFMAVRAIGGIAKNFYATFGIFLLAGGLIAVGGTYLFAEFAGHVRSGATQAFDDAVLQWFSRYRTPTLDAAMLEITFLGTGTVVIMIVAISSLFLWLTKHQYSALLLLIATGGGILLNNMLKAGFGRPRPQVVAWGTHVVSWSFPSGHAMSAAIVYGTVAYLAARLQQRPLHRFFTFLCAAVVIVLIAVSRLYLGVHYPSDVIAGITIGLAWAGFCMATLEAIQLYARNRAPKVLQHEHPPLAQVDTG